MRHFLTTMSIGIFLFLAYSSDFEEEIESLFLHIFTCESLVKVESHEIYDINIQVTVTDANNLPIAVEGSIYQIDNTYSEVETEKGIYCVPHKSENNVGTKFMSSETGEPFSYNTKVGGFQYRNDFVLFVIIVDNEQNYSLRAKTIELRASELIDGNHDGKISVHLKLLPKK